jgi:Glycosyltransferase family 87
MRKLSRRNTIEAWIVVAAFIVLWVVLGWGVQDQARSHDFLSLYCGAYLTSHGRMADLYDPAAQFALEKQLAPSNVDLVPFIRPPYYALLLAPLGWMPYRAAFACWILLQIGTFAACLLWAWRRFGLPAIVFGCMSMPAAMGTAHGQDAVLFLAILIASYTLAEKGRDLAAGFVLGLLLVKFHLTPLWPVALILQRRWKMLAGFAADGIAAVAISLAMIGVTGVRSYAALLQNPDLKWLSPSPEFMISFQGLTANFGMTSVLASVALVTAIVALFLIALWRAPLWRVYTACTAASLLLVPHVYGYDAAMLLLGLWLAVFQSSLQPTRIAALWLLTPLPFSFTLAGKPWAAVAALSLLALVVALAGEAVRAKNAPAPN